jgi:hypothetical protein
MQVEGGSAPIRGQRRARVADADMVDEGRVASAIDVSDALARIGAEYDVEVGADARCSR